MPAVSSDLKDLMCYQISKFERTMATGPDFSDKCIDDMTEEADRDMIVYQNLPAPCHHTYANCECDSVLGRSNRDRVLSHHHSFHYCPEYESRVKRSRTIRFGSGGDMTLGGEAPPPPLREKPSQRHSTHFDHRSSVTAGANNLTISVNLPVPFDLDTFLKTHSLSISINVSEKAPSSSLSGSDLRNRTDDVNRALLSQSGWYYRNVDWQESRRILRASPLGTFLVRDSSDPAYSFSLSVQTVKGPISSRISCTSGKYRLDSQISDSERMPAFDTVIALIQHYIKNGLVRSPSGRQVWIDSQGQICSQVQLTKPKLKEVGNLRHLCRLALNQNPSAIQRKISGNSNCKELPVSIESYLEDYPFSI